MGRGIWDTSHHGEWKACEAAARVFQRQHLPLTSTTMTLTRCPPPPPALVCVPSSWPWGLWCSDRSKAAGHHFLLVGSLGVLAGGEEGASVPGRSLTDLGPPRCWGSRTVQLSVMPEPRPAEASVAAASTSGTLARPEAAEKSWGVTQQ